jgi:DNA polymerase-3 subunit alpha
MPVHLHVHSNYSLLGGTASVEDLATRAAEEGMTHLALTDTNALYGAVRFVHACEKVGVQSIIGMAVTIAPPADLPPSVGSNPGLLVLLATGPDGYRSLSRLSTYIQARGDREDIRRRGISLDALAEHRVGLICIGGGRRGWVERLLGIGEMKAAARYLSRLAGIYDENVYVAL